MSKAGWINRVLFLMGIASLLMASKVTKAEVDAKPEILFYWPIDQKTSSEGCLDISGNYAYYGNDTPDSQARFRSLPFTLARVLGYDVSPSIEKNIVLVKLTQYSQEHGRIHAEFFSNTGKVKLEKFVWGKTIVGCDSQQVFFQQNGEGKGEGVSGPVEIRATFHRAIDGSLLVHLVIESSYTGISSLLMPKKAKEEYWARFAPM